MIKHWSLQLRFCSKYALYLVMEFDYTLHYIASFYYFYPFYKF